MLLYILTGENGLHLRFKSQCSHDQLQIGPWGRSGHPGMEASFLKFVQKFQTTGNWYYFIGINFSEKLLFFLFQVNEFLPNNFPPQKMAEDILVVFPVH